MNCHLNKMLDLPELRVRRIFTHLSNELRRVKALSLTVSHKYLLHITQDFLKRTLLKAMDCFSNDNVY